MSDAALPQNSGISIRLGLHKTTWADLRQFVDFGNGLPDDAPVEIAYDENHKPVALVAYSL